MRGARRLKVLFVTAWYPTPKRPVEGVFVFEHARAVARHHDVVVLHCVEPQESEPVGGRVEKVEAVTPPLYRSHRRRPGLRGAGLPASALATWRAVRRIARDGFRPEIVHAHVFSAAAPAAIVARVLGLPLVVSEHFLAIPRGTLTAAERRNARFAFRRAAVILPVSDVLRRGIEGLGVGGRLLVVPNVADPELFHPPDTIRRRDPGAPARLLTVGTMTADHVKGIPVLLEAVALLPPAAGPWELDLVGDGESRPQYEERARALGLGSRVRFHGLLEKAGVAERMRQADLFVLASRFENLPCVVLEALASGLPVVGSAVGGIPEIVSSDDGRLVPPGDPAALAAAIAEVLASPGRFDARAIARRARRYAPERVAASIDAVYRELVPA